MSDRARPLIIGPQGFQGAQGYQGAQGTQGYQGQIGSQGYQGYQGQTGPQGNQGAQGYQGAQGTQGYQGAQGNQGYQGQIGSQGTQGFQGPRGYDGDPGPQGSQGPQGNQGTQGYRGYQGPQGNDGVLTPLNPNPAGTTYYSNITVDQYGRVTSAYSGSLSGIQHNTLSNLAYGVTGHEATFAYINGNTSKVFGAQEFDLPGGWAINANSTNRIEFWQNNGYHWFYAGGDATHAGAVTATNFVLSSDRNKKDNIRPITSDPGIKMGIDAIELVAFNMKGSDRKRYGVIAQDVEANYPELVYDNEGSKTVAYIDFLILRIAKLEEKYDELKKELDNLKNSL